MLARIADRQIERVEKHKVHSYTLVYCLEKLPPMNQQLIRLCYDGQLSIQEVAKQINRPVGSLYVTLRRIRVKLWECIQRTLHEGNV